MHWWHAVDRLYLPVQGVDRLYQSKAISEGDEGKLEAVILKYDEEGKEQWVPTKEVSYDEEKEYLCELSTQQVW